MGFLSKLFSSNPANAAEGQPAEAELNSPDAPAHPPANAEVDRITPVMPAELPPDARPTPTDVFERPTIVHSEPVAEGERPTMVASEATTTALVNVMGAIPASTPALPASTRAVPASTPTLPGPTRGVPARMPAVPTAPPALPPRPAATTTPATSKTPRPAPTRAKPLAIPPVPASTRSKEAPKASTAASRPASRTAPADDLDASFAAIEAGRGKPAQPGTLVTDLSDVRALFGQLATNHMRQVRDFVIELRWGPTPAAWVAVCEPSMESLRRSAEKLEFTVLASGLRDLASAMSAVDVATTAMIEGAARDRILAAHAALEEALPEAFALDSDRSQREAAILHALLSQIPDVHKVTIDKLYAAGLTTLETLLLATTEDLVATTGIPEILGERIVERFQRYREEMASIAISETRAHERAKIDALVDQLRRQNEEFDRAAAAWTSEAIQQKKDVVLARAQTMLEIDLQLARLGEIALVRDLERLPFARKLLRLEAFLTEADTTYAKA